MERKESIGKDRKAKERKGKSKERKGASKGKQGRTRRKLDQQLQREDFAGNKLYV